MTHRQTLLLALALVAMVLAVHGPSIRGEFLWDDNIYIWNNPVAQAHQAPWGYWWTTQTSDYLPVTASFFYLQSRLWPTAQPPAAPQKPAADAKAMPPAAAKPLATPYRAVNVALHGLACVLVWQVLRALSVPGAWLGAALFAVHPVTVASTGWVAEQKNTLSLVFYALALLAYLRFDATGRWRFFGLAALVFALALLSKTSTVVLPAVLGVLLWWRRRAFWPFWQWRPWPRAAALALLFLLAAAAGIGTMWFHAHALGPIDVGPPQDLWQRTICAAMAIWFYAAKAVVPVHLCLIYPKWDLAHPGWMILAIPAVAAAAGGMLVSCLRPWGRCLAAGEPSPGPDGPPLYVEFRHGQRSHRKQSGRGGERSEPTRPDWATRDRYTLGRPGRGRA